MKKFLALLLVMVMCVAAGIGGTVAYLTDTDEAVNVMTVGNVSIEQHEYQRAEGVAYNEGESGAGKGVKEGALVPYVQGQGLYPAYPAEDGAYTAEATDLFYWGDYVYSGTAGNGLWNDTKLVGAMDKMIFVENTGNTDAYFRTVIAFECPEGMEYSEGPDKEFMMNVNGSELYKWEEIGYVEIGEDEEATRYLVMVATYQKALEPGQQAHPSLLQVVMTHNATNEDMELIGNTYEILVVTQAVQTANLESLEVDEALDVAFGDITDKNNPWLGDNATAITPKHAADNASLDEILKSEEPVTVILDAGTYTFPASNLGKGDTIICAEGTVFEGSSSLNINGATVVGAEFSNPSGNAASGTINGTFKNCTFDGSNGLRWCYAGETVVFENCVFTGDVYGIHFDGGANEAIFRNCTFSGFNAMGGAITQLTMENCTFVANGRSGYNGINLWGSTKMVGCTFVFDDSTTEWVDAMGDNKTYEFVDCVVTDGTTERPLAASDVGDYGTGNTIDVK